MSTKLKDHTIDGHTFEIQVEDNGEFGAKILGQWIKAPSLKALVEKSKSMIRRAGRIAIPVTMISSSYGRNDKEVPKITQVTLTGTHGGTSRNVLYKDEKTGKTEQGNNYGDRFYKRLTGPEIARYVELVKELHAATQAVESWKAKHVINPYELIQKAAEKVEHQPADLKEAVRQMDEQR